MGQKGNSHADTQVSEEGEVWTHAQAAIPFCLMVRQQVEPLQSSEINCQEESCLQPVEDPVQEQGNNTEKGRDSQGDLL